jgi:Icc-related predicted phosphoesterase
MRRPAFTAKAARFPRARKTLRSHTFRIPAYTLRIRFGQLGIESWGVVRLPPTRNERPPRRLRVQRSHDPERPALRIRLLSDLHLEFAAWTPPPAKQDVVVLAGDIHNGLAGIEWGAAHFECPVLYVPGNHEFYGAQMAPLREAWRTARLPAHVHVLDNARIEIGGVRFLGTTLWTDFALERDVERAIAAASRSMADYVAIRHGDRLLNARDTLALHRECLDWLRGALAEPFAGKTVVITHHCPHRGSIAPQFKNAATNPAFVSDLSELIARFPIDLWLHGHTHASRDYRVGDTRIVCNPRGYAHQLLPENAAFAPGLVVTLKRSGAG